MAGGFLLVLLAELIAVVVARRWALPIAGVAVAAIAYELRSHLAGAKPQPALTPPGNEALESLHRWKSQTDAMIRWADAGRTEWDRHLRPKLARDFMLATRQKETAAVAATGRMVFGDDLWPWVDPHNAHPARSDEPGPGRAALDEILRRLEQA
jgi:hypothetical protein